MNKNEYENIDNRINVFVEKNKYEKYIMGDYSASILASIGGGKVNPRIKIDSYKIFDGEESVLGINWEKSYESEESPEENDIYFIRIFVIGESSMSGIINEWKIVDAILKLFNI